MTKDEWGKLNIDMIIDTNVVLCNGHERCNLIHPLNEVSIKNQISPMAKQCRSTSRRFSGLVRISAVISFVGQKWISICFLLISWQICHEDCRQGPKNKQPQPNLQPSLAKIDEGIGQGS